MNFKFRIIICKIVCCFLIRKKWREYIRSYFRIDEYKEFKFFYDEINNKKVILQMNLNIIENVFVGSSHVAYGFNPRFFFSNSINLGSNSQDLFTSYCLLKYIIEKCRKIKCIFIEYAVFSNGNNLAYVKNKYIPSIYHYLYKINYERENYILNYAKFIVDFKDNNLNASNDGYLSPPPIHAAASVENRALTHMREHVRTNSQMFYYNKIHQLVKKNNIKLYVVTFPVRSDLIKAFPQKENLFKEINEMSKEKGFTYLNFYDDSEFDWDDFWDYDHLNESGAEKFTKKLKAVVESIEQ